MAIVNFDRKPEGFRLLPEGVHDLMIGAVTATPRAKVQNVEVEFFDKDGLKLVSRYNLDNKYGYAAFYRLVETGCGFVLDGEFDIDNIIGKYVNVEVIHKDGTTPREDGTLPKFVNIKYVNGPGTPFEDAPAPATVDEDMF